MYGSALPCILPPVDFSDFVTSLFPTNSLNSDVMFPSKCYFPRLASNGRIYLPSFHITFMLQELIKIPQAGKLFQVPADRMTVKMF